MSKLDSELKRLMSWAGRVSPFEPGAAPFGFASRVVALWKPTQAGSVLLELKQMAWSWGCVAVVVIFCGLVVLSIESGAPEPAGGLPSALGFLASNLTP